MDSLQDIKREVLYQKEIQDSSGYLLRPPVLEETICELHILRRWNSSTPIHSQHKDSCGGGYYLNNFGCGTIIDPGIGFAGLFSEHFSVQDIHCIIITHDHIDHCNDTNVLLTAVRELNEKKEFHKKPHVVQLLLSRSSYNQYKNIIDANPRWIRARILDINMQYDYVRYFGYELETMKCQHNELSGEKTGFGLKLLFEQKNILTLGISSDTGYYEGIENKYNETDILVLHIGTMENPDEYELLKNHLGSYGIINLLKNLRHKPKLTVITEWGEECISKRLSICEAIKMEVGNIPTLPADLELRVRLNDAHVFVNQSNNYFPPETIKPWEEGNKILYRRK